MTQVFALSVPTDIPWRRVCASGDMHDADPCDLAVPPRWRSSIALFRYDPEDSFQPYHDLHVTYLKLTVTLTPFAPELDIQLGRREVDNSAEMKRQRAFVALRESKAEEETELWLRRLRDEAYVEYRM